jgi:ribonuclease J
LGEIGMNCLALDDGESVVLVDAGVTFDGRDVGVDVVHPDFSVLDPVADRLRALLVTHGHEDHIGAIPYLLRRFDIPVFGPPYALGLLRARAEEHPILDEARFIETQPGRTFSVGAFDVEPIRVAHSIADATALAIRTPIGRVVHTGDFKFDDGVSEREQLDVARFARLGDEGVALLFSDSTNIDARGPTGSERGVTESLERLVGTADGAVVVGVFASNVHRLRALGNVAERTGRHLLTLGRSMQTHARVARETGELVWPDGLQIPAERARALPRNRILAIATGSQAEANATLMRLAHDEHTALKLEPGDRVILSSRTIPGNEREVSHLMTLLLRLGVDLRSWATDRDVHVSGHAHREEQARMLDLVRPRCFVPVHGTLHHLTRHAALARERGVREVAVIENGTVLETDGHELRVVGRTPVPRVHIAHGRVVSPVTLRERRSLAQAGCGFVHATLDAEGRLVETPTVWTHGVSEDEERRIRSETHAEIRTALERLSRAERCDDGIVTEHVRLALRRVLTRTTGSKPVTKAIVVRRT